MKVATNITPVIRVGADTEEYEFRIKSTPKAFQILTSNLYKDKIAAIVRELSCNAFDSHVEAGRPDRKFRVQLPNGLNPRFIIRDFGVGLSDTAIREIFTTFFESTKEDTNDQIGALGLGCKSPFSYTDTFTVKSFFEGKETTFVCFIENRLPKVRKVSKVDSSQETGLEITIPVKEQDFFTFSSRASIVYRWFNNKPEVIGSNYNYREASAPDCQGKRWVREVYFPSSTAVMGQVAYPINASVMEEYLSIDEAKLLKSFVFYFDIGDLDVQAGREELSYDPVTIKAIARRIKATHRDIARMISAEFAQCKTLVEANRQFLATNKTTFFTYSNPLWKGVQLTGLVPCPIKSGKLQVHPRQGAIHHRFAKKNNPKPYEVKDIEPREDVTVWVDDLARGGFGRFLSKARNLRGLAYYYRPDEVTIPEALDAFAEFDVRRVSSTPANRSKAKMRIISIRARDHLYHLKMNSREEVSVDLEEGGTYITTKSHDFCNGADTINDELVQSLLKLFWLPDTEPTVYTVPWTLRKKVKEHAGWNDLIEVCRSRIVEALKDDEFRKDVCLFVERNSPRPGSMKHVKFSYCSGPVAQSLPETHPFSQVNKAMNKTLSSQVVYYGHAVLAFAEMGEEFFKSDEFVVNKLWRETGAFPLLKAIVSDTNLGQAEIKELVDYTMNKIDSPISDAVYFV